MNISNTEVAQAFEQIAILLELENANPFRIRAYRNAAHVIDEFSRPISDLLTHKVDLTEYKGIGKDLADKIKVYAETGHIPLLDELLQRHPKEILELLRVENLGPKRIQMLHDQLGISSLEDLEQAAEKKKIRELKGFGEKTEQKILDGIKQLSKVNRENRMLLHSVDTVAAKLLKYLKAMKGVNKIEVAGSYRRRQETIGDLDILVTCDKPQSLIEHFVSFENIKEITSKGTTRSSVVLNDGLHVDLRVLKEESFGSGLHYFTGSKSHNIEVRKIAKNMGLKINEYGVFRDDIQIAGRTEEEVFAAINLDFIPPVLRENRGEIKAAEEHRLPNLITISDLQGDLHTHSNATDGKNSILEMATKALAMGHKYLAITDHSQKVRIAGGLDVNRLKKHIEDIDRANDLISGIEILKGIEVDILEDGSLDLPNSILSELDIRICSIHFKFKMNKDEMTERIIRAMDNPYFNILGHPTGRLIFKRSPYEFDLEKIVKAAVERGKFFEINGQPYRLDLNAENCQMAQDLGAKFAISSDAHSTTELSFLNYGTDQARRGWVEKNNVINTLTCKELKKLLHN